MEWVISLHKFFRRGIKLINQRIEAYSADSDFEFDNKIILEGYSQRILEKILDNRKTFNGLKILDLGLGRGYVCEKFDRVFDDYTVLEADDRIISLFTESHPNIRANIVQTNFEDYISFEKYDIIVLGFVLEHVDHPIDLIKKYKDYLKDDGTLYASVPNAESLNRRIGILSGMISDIYELSENDIALGHKRYYDKKSFMSDCLEAGLKIDTMEGVFLKPLSSKQMVGLNLNNNIIDAYVRVGRDYPELSLAMLADLHK